MRYLRAAAACAFLVVALVLAPAATAAPPDCTQTGPRTTQCTTSGGSTQIVTSPQQRTYNQYPWYGWGGGWGISIGGGGGINIGGGRR
jgi:hypothetical protein